MATSMGRKFGRVARVVRDKGFGFIKVESRDGNEQEYFYHRSTCDGQFDAIFEGDKVEFEALTGGEKGNRAEHVVKR